MASKRICVVYHHNDPDGNVAGAIALNEAKIFGMETYAFEKGYADEFKDHFDVGNPQDELHLIFTDLSFTGTSAAKLINSLDDDRVFSVTWIDHHASSEESVHIIANRSMYHKIKGVDFNIIFSTNLCGACLTYYWKELQEWYRKSSPGIKSFMPVVQVDSTSMTNPSIGTFNVAKINTSAYKISSRIGFTLYEPAKNLFMSMNLNSFLYHLDNYDRWTGKDPNADEFCAGIKLGKYNHCKIAEGFDKDIMYYINPTSSTSANAIIRDGKICLDYQMSIHKEYSNYIDIRNIFGCKIAMKTGIGNSWNFNDLLPTCKVDAAILLQFDPKSKTWEYHIYGNTLNALHVGKIAEGFGGGGHPGAAGFHIKECLADRTDDQVESLISTKYPKAKLAFLNKRRLSK